jgi:hypothetical protein
MEPEIPIPTHIGYGIRADCGIVIAMGTLNDCASLIELLDTNSWDDVVVTAISDLSKEDVAILENAYTGAPKALPAIDCDEKGNYFYNKEREVKHYMLFLGDLLILQGQYKTHSDFMDDFRLLVGEVFGEFQTESAFAGYIYQEGVVSATFSTQIHKISLYKKYPRH